MAGSEAMRRAPRRHPASTAATPHRSVRPSPTQGGYEVFEPSTGTEERPVTVVAFVLEPSETPSTCFREGSIAAYWETPRELGGKELMTGPPSIQMTSSRTSPPSWLAEGSRPADDDCCHHEHGQRYLWALVVAGQHAHPSVMSGSGERVVLVFTTLTFATAFMYFLVMRNMGRHPWTTGAAAYAWVYQAGTPWSADCPKCQGGRRCRSYELPWNRAAGDIKVVDFLDASNSVPCDPGGRQETGTSTTVFCQTWVPNHPRSIAVD
ncbi:hypothetical protein MRX96_022570 [Rhipicephalus microplus]